MFIAYTPYSLFIRLAGSLILKQYYLAIAMISATTSPLSGSCAAQEKQVKQSGGAEN
jgi:hypothetical protein